MAEYGITQRSYKGLIYVIHSAGFVQEYGVGPVGYYATYTGGKVQLSFDRGLVVKGATDPARIIDLIDLTLML